MSNLYTVRKSGDNYVILFRGRAEGPAHATRETARKYARIMEAERKQRLARASELTFLRSLFQRSIDGETIRLGESYIYLDGPNVAERTATQDDVDAVNRAIAGVRGRKDGRAV